MYSISSELFEEGYFTSVDPIHDDVVEPDSGNVDTILF